MPHAVNKGSYPCPFAAPEDTAWAPAERDSAGWDDAAGVFGVDDESSLSAEDAAEDAPAAEDDADDDPADEGAEETADEEAAEAGDEEAAAAEDDEDTAVAAEDDAADAEEERDELFSGAEPDDWLPDELMPAADSSAGEE